MRARMRILILDDEEVRHTGFSKMLPGHDLTHVYSYEESVVALEGAQFDIAYLDHDLGVGCAETGYDVAMFIAGMPEDKRPAKVVIHSHNPIGARRMGQALLGKTRAMIYPYQAPK